MYNLYRQDQIIYNDSRKPMSAYGGTVPLLSTPRKDYMRAFLKSQLIVGSLYNYVVDADGTFIRAVNFMHPEKLVIEKKPNITVYKLYSSGDRSELIASMQKEEHMRDYIKSWISNPEDFRVVFGSHSVAADWFINPKYSVDGNKQQQPSVDDVYYHTDLKLLFRIVEVKQDGTIVMSGGCEFLSDTQTTRSRVELDTLGNKFVRITPYNFMNLIQEINISPLGTPLMVWCVINRPTSDIIKSHVGSIFNKYYLQ